MKMFRKNKMMKNEIQNLSERVFLEFLNANNTSIIPDFKNSRMLYQFPNSKEKHSEEKIRGSQAYQGFIDGFTGQIHLYRDALKMQVPENCDYNLQYNLGKHKRGKI